MSLALVLVVLISLSNVFSKTELRREKPVKPTKESKEKSLKCTVISKITCGEKFLGTLRNIWLKSENSKETFEQSMKEVLNSDSKVSMGPIRKALTTWKSSSIANINARKALFKINDKETKKLQRSALHRAFVKSTINISKSVENFIKKTNSCPKGLVDAFNLTDKQIKDKKLKKEYFVDAKVLLIKLGKSFLKWKVDFVKGNSKKITKFIKKELEKDCEHEKKSAFLDVGLKPMIKNPVVCKCKQSGKTISEHVEKSPKKIEKLIRNQKFPIKLASTAKPPIKKVSKEENKKSPKQIETLVKNSSQRKEKSASKSSEKTKMSEKQPVHEKESCENLEALAKEFVKIYGEEEQVKRIGIKAIKKN